MRDFNDYINGRNNGNTSQGNNNGTNGFSENTADFLKNIMGKFDGKSTGELYKAVIEEAKRRKTAGTLSNEEIDSFSAVLSPLLDEGKRKYLEKIVAELKNL